jgi:outer membrane lipoprotein-sorting protein
MKNIAKLTSIYLLVLVLCTASSAMAASFSADMVIEKKGETETGKFYLLDQYYRLEILENGKPMVIIADRKKNVHRVLNMEKKVFFEIPSDDFGVLINDPFKASEYMVSQYGSKVEGTEKINGIKCEKQVVISQDTKIHSRWFSTKLKFPVKLVSYRGEQASYVAELKAIRNVDLQMDLFKPPADFKQVEVPGAAEERKLKRKREAERKNEEALSGLTTVETAQAPCYVKIAGGGELRVPINIDRKAYLEITNQAKDESVYTVLKYQNGKPMEGYEATPWTLERKGHYKKWEFNDEFAQKTRSFLVDEVRIKVEKGLIYAALRQVGTDRTDIYNIGGSHIETYIDPKRPFTVRITGDNPFGDQTTGKFWLRYAAGGSSEAIPFAVATGKTRTWDYPADKGGNAVAVSISKGDGRAKISLVQPPYPKKATPKQSTVKKRPKPTYTPKPKTVTQFTVTHPAGTGKPLTPGKDLTITVTGVSGDAMGTIDLYSDRKKTKKIDAFKFKLKKNQVESFTVSGEKNVAWATVWVHKGSFKVKLDQSPNAKAAPTPKTNKGATATSGAGKQTAPKSAASGADKPTASTGTIFNGEVPLYKGARVIKTKSYGANSMAELQVDATPQELVDFYKQAMSAKGWKASMAMVQGNVGILQLKKNGGQLIFKVEGRGQTSKVSIALMGQ